MKIHHHLSRLLLLAGFTSALALPSSSRATPYASQLTNNGGTVSFVLNESADDVKIVFGTTTNSLGALAAGSYTNNAGATSPFFVYATKNSGAGYKTPTTVFSGTIFNAGRIQISSDTNLLNRFPTPRGVAVNKNPASPYFGRIYVANSTEGTTATRPVGRGLYTLKADFSDSSNQYGDSAQTAGLPFAVSANAPYRISVGQDDLVYISDFSDVSGGVYRMNGDLQNGEIVLDGVGGPTILPPGQNHGSTAKVVAEGSLASNNLKIYTIDEDYPGTANNNLLLRYDVDGGPIPSTVPPVTLSSLLLKAGVVPDFCKGTNGYFYVSQNRANVATIPCIYILDPNGVQITNTLALWRAFTGNSAAGDAFTDIYSIAVSPDGSYLAAIRLSSGNSKTWVVPLTNGIPDVSQLKLLDTGTVTQGRGVDFDVAGNLYTISSGDAALRAFSPGGTTTAITGSDGTFRIAVPPATISMATTTTNISEADGTSTITFTRAGETAGTLTVNLGISGTASNGVDYALIPSTITFGAGASTTNLTITASQDSIAELTETITVSISNSVNYAVGSPASATVFILDDEPAVLNITATQPRLLENYSFATAVLQVRRLGLISGALTANIQYSGGTLLGSDFNGQATVNLAANAATTNFTLTPINNTNYTGNRSISVNLVTGSGYTPGVTNSATVTLIDDEFPTGATLFADNFDVDSSVNWNINSVDGFFDTYADWAFDYGQAPFGIPSAPHSTGGSTKGVRLRANQFSGAITGLSISPANQHFTNDYRLTVDMWMNYNGPLPLGGAGSTEGGSAGVATSGFTPQSPGGSAGNFGTQDGVWFAWNSDADIAAGDTALRDFNAYVPSSPAPLTASNGVYTAGTNTVARDNSDPYYIVWGRATAPAAQLAAFPGPGAATNQTGVVRDGALGMSWHTVSVTKFGTNVTWTIDGVLISTVDITPFLPVGDAGTPSGFNLGDNISLGHEDDFASTNVNPEVSFLLFDNVRVETIVLPSVAPTIIKIQVVGGQVQIDFTGGVGDLTTSFKLRSSAEVVGPYGDDNTAVITSLGGNSFRATTAVSGTTRFYRIVHL